MTDRVIGDSVDEEADHNCREHYKNVVGEEQVVYRRGGKHCGRALDIHRTMPRSFEHVIINIQNLSSDQFV